MADEKPTEGEEWYGNEVLEVRDLSLDEWLIFRVPGSKSEEDFIVKVINEDHPQGISVQHAHFAIDFFGKLHHDEEAAMELFDAIVSVWHGEDVDSVLQGVAEEVEDLPGYHAEYVLKALDWILRQEDINYSEGSRPERKQKELDEAQAEFGVETPEGREGSQITIGLLSDIAAEIHPVEALRRAGLVIRSR